LKKEADPAMHSAEHILNQVMDRMFKCGRAFSIHLEKKKSKCDYHFNQALTAEQELQIEEKVNEIIRSDLPITEEYLDRTAAQSLYNLARLPEDAGNRIRIVKIGDFDACPCIGPHVACTKKIGRFQMISTSFENNILRIRFKLENKGAQ
jgi:Ser-tRNA(Ala) deacylase AlaX